MYCFQAYVYVVYLLLFVIVVRFSGTKIREMVAWKETEPLFGLTSGTRYGVSGKPIGLFLNTLSKRPESVARVVSVSKGRHSSATH